MGKIEKSLILDNYIRRRKSNQNTELCEKKKKREALRRLSIILRKCETLRTSEEIKLLESGSDIVKQILLRQDKVQQSKERTLEKEDPYETIDKKAQRLADVISKARHLVCYTGAGISTSARIPDYRGSQGIWTLLQKGQDIGQYDLSLAEPTFTHMALYELHRRNILQYVLSQNCDGLHLRSGLPRNCLSEVHGNMYVEVCKNCKPNVEYWRLFDTTEQTARYYHKTNRRCHFCGKPIVDTIVHFGERGSLRWPLNWEGACNHAEKADAILCLGSSLKVLKKYSWLWAMDRSKNKRPKIYIVNLQWTPKDAVADIKINGKCDEVMRLVMKYLNIKVPKYSRLKDPIFSHASLLAPEEMHTVTQPMLKSYEENLYETKKTNCLEDIDGIITEFKKIKRELPDLIPINKKDTDCSRNCHTNILDKDLEGSPKKIATLLPRRVLTETKNDNSSKVHIITSSTLSDSEKETLSSTGRFVDLKEKTSQNDIKSSKLNIDPPQVENKSQNKIKEKISKQITEALVSKDCSQVSSSSSSLLPSPIQKKSREMLIRSPTSQFESPTVESLYLGRDKSEADNCSINKHSGNQIKLSQKSNQAHPVHSLHPQQSFCDNRNLINDLEYLRETQSTVFNGSILTPAHTVFNGLPKSLIDINSIKERSIDKGDRLLSGKPFCRDNDEYNCLLNYCKAAIQKSLPHWYDVDYAYSGLHSIIHPPPNEVDIWDTIFIPIFQLNRNEAECEFCFDNYAEYTCQFYRGRKPEFLFKKQRGSQVIVCECCDWLDESNGEHQIDSVKQETMTNGRDSNDKTNDNEQHAKLDIVLKETTTSSATSTTKIQAGWYGKGYRKLVRKKRKTKLSPLVTV